MAFTLGETDQREAPHAQPQLDEHQPHNQVRQGVDKTLEPFRIQRVALGPALGLLRMAAHQPVNHHAQHHQHGADQRLAQRGAGIAR